jgi:hypothetical protein
MKALLEGSRRPLGIYIAGNPGFGKSSLIQKMALDDIRRGRGVCVIDPTGDLVERLVHWAPQERVRKEEIIYFDTDNPVPIDFFSYKNPAERQVLTDQLLNIFNLDNAPISRPRLQKILGTLFDANDNPYMREKDICTFLDIQSFIEDETRRHTILSYCPQRNSQWPDKTFAKLADFVSIIERMTPFTESPILRTIFEAKKPKLNIAEVMRKKQVLLINLKDTPTDFFVGSLIASKFQQATFAKRYSPREAKRTPYYLYIDECHTVLGYAVKEFEQILTRARKYKLCLILANQIPSDLPPQILRKLGTIQTQILFNLDSNDARIFKDRIRPVEPEELLDLPEFHAICRSGRSVHRVKTPRFLGPSPASYAKIIKRQTQEIYRVPASYAESDQKRPVDSPPSHTAPEPLPLIDDIKFEPSSAPKDVPPHRS